VDVFGIPVTVPIYNFGINIRYRFGKRIGLQSTEIAVAILHLLVQGEEKTLQEDLQNLCGSAMDNKIGDILTHKMELITSFEVTMF